MKVDMAPKAKKQFGIQSIEVGSRILDVMIELGRPAALKDIARLAKMHPGKVHRYLVSYVRSELVAQDESSGLYGIGPKAIALGLAGLRSMDVVRCASELLPSLRDTTEETAFLAVWGTYGPVVFRLEESSRPVFLNVRVGSTLPILSTATGRVFAAYLPPEQTRQMIAAERAAAEANERFESTQTDKILSDTRVRGIGRVVGDLVPGVAALAAPVFNHIGRVAAVIGVLGRLDQMDTNITGRVATALKECCADISRRLGYDINAMER